MNLSIKVNVKLGNAAAQNTEDVRKDVLETIEGLFTDVEFCGAMDDEGNIEQLKCDTAANIIDLNGHKIGTVTLEVK